jgi:hypothetical protein
MMQKQLMCGQVLRKRNYALPVTFGPIRMLPAPERRREGAFAHEEC